MMPANSTNEVSPLWTNIVSNTAWTLDSFRKPGNINSRFAAWEPRELSLRWYRTFLNLAFVTSSDTVKDWYAELGTNLDLGKPVVNDVIHKGKRFSVNLDYLMAFEEAEFISRERERESEIRSVCEVGAGFGRLAHVLLLLHKEIEQYIIIDLPEVLKLSQQYLQMVLPSIDFEKLLFVQPNQIPHELLEPDKSDLAIQVDGLQEMTVESLERYFLLFSNSRTFYSKNVVAKYLPSHAGLEIPASSAPLSLGRSLEICDVWNIADLESCHMKHLDSYKPECHEIVFSRLDRLFPHYCSFVSKRNVSRSDS